MISTPPNMDHSNPRLEFHMRFICPECGREYQSHQQWRRHLNDAHKYNQKTYKELQFRCINDRLHECNICKKKVANGNQAVALLQYHYFMHLPHSPQYRCRHCTAGFMRKRALSEHLYRSHGREILLDEKKQREAVDTPPPSGKDNPEFYLRFVCPQCGKIFNNFQTWLNHVNSAHYLTTSTLKMYPISGTKNHYCIECKQLLYTDDKTKLQRHRFTHLPYKEYFMCAFCSVKKIYKADILKHFIHTHRAEFTANRSFLKKPVEWGCNANEKLNVEEAILIDTEKGKSLKDRHKKGDLIQRALMESLIDLEKEAADDLKQITKTASECALDQSLRELRALLRNDLATQAKSRVPESDKQLPTQNLDDLCKEMFDHIDKETEQKQASGMTGAKAGDEVKRETVEDTNEQIISIEIDTLNEDEETDIKSPPKKRMKINIPAPGPINPKDLDEKTKARLETYINYLCPKCGILFDRQPAWRQHVFIVHNIEKALEKNFKLLEDGTYLCLVCLEPQNTKKGADLKRHHFLHMRYQSYLKCTICKCTKPSKPRMLIHLLYGHGHHLAENIANGGNSTKNKCEHCGKVFARQNTWQNHRATCLQRKKIRNFSIPHNLRLIAYLKKAHTRLRRLRTEMDAETVPVTNGV